MKDNAEIYGILGERISYSLSPLIYNTLFEEYKIPAVYKKFDLPFSRISQFVNSVRLLGINGFNVTIPHKKSIIKYLDSLDRIANKTGSVNLVINKRDKLIGYNTDLTGIMATIEQKLKCDLRDAEILIIGSGGSAYTAYRCVLSKKPKRITVIHRTAKRRIPFENFVRATKSTRIYRALSNHSDIGTSQFELCINCTPVSIRELLSGEQLKRMKNIFELRYGSYPLFGRNHVRGNYMLAVQAAENFKLMTNIDVRAETTLKIINGALKK